MCNLHLYKYSTYVLILRQYFVVLPWVIVVLSYKDFLSKDND